MKLIIIACNTATVSSISYLRDNFKVPLIGVVPVVKMIADKTKTGSCAVFSTPATAKSEYLNDLIKIFGGKAKIYKVGSSGLEHLIEKGITKGPEIDSAIKKALTPLKSKNVDTIALGCTHYPFITPAIKSVVGLKVQVFDSGGAIARRTRQVLENENLLSDKKGSDFYYTTGDAKKFKIVAEKLLKTKLAGVERAEI